MADSASAPPNGNQRAATAATARQPAIGSVRLSTEKLSSSYCNVCTVNSTREEVVVSFGVNQDWDRMSPELAVSLLKRIILSPHGAKRLNDRLTQVLSEYEKRFGELKP